jgi:hypothetical protein
MRKVTPLGENLERHRLLMTPHMRNLIAEKSSGDIISDIAPNPGR